MSAQEADGPGMNVRFKEFLFSSRTAPTRATTQASHVRARKYNGSTRIMAAAYNVTPRTVSRWLDGTRSPRGDNSLQLRREATEVQTTQRSREQRARKFAERKEKRSGIQARVGRANTFNIRGSDAVRMRDAFIDLTGEQAAVLARATDEAEVEAIIKDALAAHFNGGLYGGFNPADFEFDVNDVTYSGELLADPQA